MTRSLKLMELKSQGHAIIDEIVALGIERNEVYRRLKKRMKYKGSDGHFSRMHHVTVASDAVFHLRHMRDNIISDQSQRAAIRAAKKAPVPSKKSLSKQAKASYKATILPNTKQKSIYKELRRRQRVAKIFRFLAACYLVFPDDMAIHTTP